MTDKRNTDKGNMSVSEAGKKGSQATSKSHGKEFYEDIGHKGGENSGWELQERS
ncbi:KGG domain-containing protein [Halomonas sp. WWR20]